MLKLDAVTVCVGYGDFLAHTLPINKGLFNRQVIVTSSKDEETQRICKVYNVQCVITDCMYKNGQKFNKGLAVNAGLEVLDFQDWCVHLDADIVLPPLTRHILQTVQLNEQFLYGVDRVMVPSYEYWARFMSSPLPQHEMAYIYVGPFPVGVRIMKLEDGRGGWVPLGYFQMFNRLANALAKKPWYPVEWDTAATSDLYFAYKWPRTHRHLVPEVVCYHLGTEDQAGGKMGHNWEGRKTARFEPRDQYLVNTFRPPIAPDPAVVEKEKLLNANASNPGSGERPAK